MTRLRRVDAAMPGWTRRRAGKGFSYLDGDGNRLPEEDVERIRALAIPPAWTDVWICPVPNGHLQAVGTDDAGRRQYLYHPEWRGKRDRLKFEKITAAATRLPGARRRISRDIAAEGMGLERACATAVRLLDVGYFRIGNDAYADANGSFGLTTLERRHVRRRGDSMVFSFEGKSGIAHTVVVDDEAAVAALEVMRSRRADDAHLLAHKADGHWRPLGASEVNQYLAELFDGEVTAKDFRTWHATVIAAEVLALTDEPGDSKASRQRAVKQAVLETSNYLGNTAAVARNSYIDPRVIDHYEAGETIRTAATRRYRTPTARQGGLEKALLELLG
ncbi:DNA topoisomerase IB [Tessaracoccus terricola]